MKRTARSGSWRELQLETLVELSMAMGGLRSEGEILEELLQRAVGTLDARVGLVATRTADGGDRDGRALGLEASYKLGATLLGTRLDELAAGQAVSFERVGKTPRWILAVPLLWQTETYGLVVLGDRETRSGPEPFAEEDLRFLASLARLGAAALFESRAVAKIERDRQRLEEENKVLKRSVERIGFIGEHPSIRLTLDQVRRVAPTDVSVLLRGESGTGKERIARLTHDLSSRADGPFVPLNCAALPENLLEAELFGIEAGVATGVTQRLGKLELASGGTLFLDEIGDLPLALQSKLLRVVQEREVERIGGRERIAIDLRILAATHRSLEEMVSEGEFRQDLYYRIRVVELRLPALRHRRSDIPLLARHFLDLFGQRLNRPTIRLGREAGARLMSHPFPGNVRELENIIQALVALAPSDLVTVEDIDLALGSRPSSLGVNDELIALADLEAIHIERVLQAVGGNKSAAARILGIDRSTLYRKMREIASLDAERNSHGNSWKHEGSAA